MTDNTEQTQIGWRFRLWWMLASTVVLALGVTVGGVAILIGAAFGGAGVLIGAVFGSVFGILLGIAQWRVLRRHVSWSGRWRLFTAVGGAASFAIAVAIVIIFLPYRSGFIFGSFDTEFMAATVLGIVIVIGASLGIAQWFVLRRKVSGSGLWVLASAAGPAVIYLVIFYASSFSLDRIEGFSERTTLITSVKDGVTSEQVITSYDPQKVVNAAVFAGVVGAVFGYGAITGGALAWLLRQPEGTEFKLDRRTRTRLLRAAVFLIVPMAGYFLSETIRTNNIIAGLQVPPCSEVYIAPLIRDRRITTCHIKRAHCAFYNCTDAPFESRSFILVGDSNAGFRLDNFDGECLLVTGEAHMRGETPAIFAYDQSDVEICQ